MKVALSTPGKFHTFELARQLLRHEALAAVLTGYPRFKLRIEAIPDPLLKTFPWFMGPYMAFRHRERLPPAVVREWEYLVGSTFAAWAAKVLPPCGVYVGLSGSSLVAGRLQQQRGGKYVVDRGSSHIRVQARLLEEEHRVWGFPYQGIDPRVIAREEAEYAQADAITVPSGFALRTFVEKGLSIDKVHLLPYGVNLDRFAPVGEPTPTRFDVLFAGGMSLQKGVPYLVQAYARLKHPAKSLTFVGAPSQRLIDALRQKGIWPAEAKVMGHVPQTSLKEIMSRSHVLVLPSVQEGFGMVMAQAMACGCPVIASDHTGAADLFCDGEEGFVVPIRDVDSLTERLQRMADDPALRQRMSVASLACVQKSDGWKSYGDRAMAIYRSLVTR